MSKQANRRTLNSKGIWTNIVVFLVTMLGNLVYGSNASPDDYKAFVVLLFWSAAAFLFLALLANLILDFFSTFEKYKKFQEEFVQAAQAVPQFVRFRKREDSLIIYPDGTGVFFLSYEVSSKVDDGIHELTIPVAFDVGKTEEEPGARVTVRNITVDDRPISTEQRYIPLETRYDTRDFAKVMEYGILRIPVDLSVGRTTCRICVELEMKGAFSAARNGGDYVIVDIPYVTEDLRVSVSSADGGRIEFGQERIEAKAAMMELTDPPESARCGNELKCNGEKVSWHTKYPKLGYRYTLSFRIVPASLKDELSNAPSQQSDKVDGGIRKRP